MKYDANGNLKKISKKSLRVMRKTRAKHPIREEGRILKYGTKGWIRNIWLSMASIAVMSVTMIILFITVVASVILTNTAEMMRDKIDITIYLKPQTEKEVLEELSTILSGDSNVKSVVVSTSEQEYEKLVEEYAESEEILGAIEEELILSHMQAAMRVKVYDIDNLDSIKAVVENNEMFQKYADEERLPTYDVNQVEIATINSWAQIAQTGGIVLAAVFLAISVLIIFSTIRMAIFSRREEIYMMKLVGADKRFIRGPFLVEAEICGVVAGVIAATVSYFGFMAVAPALSDYGINVDTILSLLESNQLVLMYVIFIAIGVIIGRVSARLAVSKYLHKT